MRYEQVLERFRGAKRSDEDHAEAFCPVHETDSDHHRRSLSVNRGDRKTLVRCHAGCATEAVVAAAGLRQADLFDDADAPDRAARAPSSSATSPPLSEAQVESMARALREDGGAWEHLIEVLRFSSGVVEQLRLGLYVAGGRRWISYPNRQGDGWSYANCRSLDGPKDFVRSPKGQRTAVYRGELLEPNGTAILFEGERDVAAALTIGLAAAAADGAAIVGMPGIGHVRVAAEALAHQARVFVFLDSDDAGDAAANQLIDILGEGRCRRVRLEGFKDLGDLLSTEGPDRAREIAVEAVNAAISPAPTVAAAGAAVRAAAMTPCTPGAEASDGERDPISALTESSPLAQVKTALEALGATSKLLTRVDRALERERAVGALKTVKAVSAPAALVDTFLAANLGEAKPTTTLSLHDDERAAEPQDAGQLLGDLVAVFERHAVLPRGAPAVLGTWVMHTWALAAAYFTPRILLTSPTKRCGKTLVLDLLQATCRRSILSANLSSAVVYRVVESVKPTLLVDEADSFLGANDELRGILNAGYKSDGTVLRCDGDNNEPRAFNCYSPVAIAAIGELPDTIADRGLTIRLARKGRGEKVVRLDRRAREELTALRPRLARLAEDGVTELRDAQPEVPESLNDRQRDICEPLLAIADLAGGHWPARVRDAIVALCAASDTDSADQRERLLAAVWALYDDATEFMTQKKIVEHLLADESSEWLAIGKNEKPLTTRVLGKWLKPFGLKPSQPRSAGQERGYSRDDLLPVVQKYVASGDAGNVDRVTVSRADNPPDAREKCATAATVSPPDADTVTDPEKASDSGTDTPTRSGPALSQAEKNIEAATAILGGQVIAVEPLSAVAAEQLLLVR